MTSTLPEASCLPLQADFFVVWHVMGSYLVRSACADLPQSPVAWSCGVVVVLCNLLARRSHFHVACACMPLLYCRCQSVTAKDMPATVPSAILPSMYVVCAFCCYSVA